MSNKRVATALAHVLREHCCNAVVNLFWEAVVVLLTVMAHVLRERCCNAVGPGSCVSGAVVVLLTALALCGGNGCSVA